MEKGVPKFGPCDLYHRVLRFRERGSSLCAVRIQGKRIIPVPHGHLMGQGPCCFEPCLCCSLGGPELLSTPWPAAARLSLLLGPVTSRAWFCVVELREVQAP